MENVVTGGMSASYDRLTLFSDPLPAWEAGARLYVAKPNADKSVRGVGGFVMARTVYAVDEVRASWRFLGAYPRAATFVAASLRSRFPTDDLHHWDFSFADFRSVSWKGVDLHGLKLTAANFSDATLDEANLSGSVLDGADFSRASLIGAYLVDADLRSALFHNANLSQAVARGANFEAAGLTYADLTSAELGQANLRRSSLSGAKLNGTGLTGADLTRVDWFPGDDPPFGWTLDDKSRLTRSGD